MNENTWIYAQQISTPVIILAATILIAIFFRKIYQKFIKTSSRIMQNDPTNYKFVGHVLTALIYIVGISWAIYEIPQMRQIAKSLLAGAGILAVAAGFASQHALSNIISGLFIIIFKPFRVNDRLFLRDTMQGIVEDITLRHTIIRDFENRRIIIPNTVISDEIIINFDFVEDKIVRKIEFNVGMDSDIDLIKSIIEKEAEQHPLFIDNRKPHEIIDEKPKVPIKVVGFTDYGITIRAYTWTKNASEAFEISCDLMESVKKEFDKQGVRMAVANKNITLTN